MQRWTLVYFKTLLSVFRETLRTAHQNQAIKRYIPQKQPVPEDIRKRWISLEAEKVAYLCIKVCLNSAENEDDV